MIGKICPILNLKPTHFNNGWASFDNISFTQLRNIMESGCIIGKDIPVLRTILIMTEYPDTQCFGEISRDGVIKLQGLRGFPTDDVCIRFITDLTETASRRKIEDSYFYVEW
jgi:hypothetical protein